MINEDSKNNVVGETIRKLRKRKGIKQKELAEQVGVTNNLIYKYEKGIVKNIPNKNLKKIADALGVEVNIFYEIEDSDDYLKYLKTPHTKQPELTPINPSVINGMVPKLVPIFGSVPAGKPIEALQNKIEDMVVLFDAKDADKPYFGLKVRGDSMYPNYMEDDVVIVEKTMDFNSGDDVIVYVGDDFEATLKRIHRQDDKVILEPLNKEYRKRTFDRNSVSLTIVGVVRKLIRTMG